MKYSTTEAISDTDKLQQGPSNELQELENCECKIVFSFSNI